MIPQFFHYCSSKFFRLSLLEWYRYLFSKVNRKLPETNKILKSGKSYTQGNKKGARKNLNIKSLHLRSDLVFTSKPWQITVHKCDRPRCISVSVAEPGFFFVAGAGPS